jgi:hypothetical protein
MDLSPGTVSSKSLKSGVQQGFCKIRATEYRLKYIGNPKSALYLGRIKQKSLRPKQAAVILMPVLRKAPNVACYPMGHSLLFMARQFSYHHHDYPQASTDFNST